MAGSRSGSIAFASGVKDSVTDEGCLWSLSGVEVLPSSFFSSENFSVPLVVAPPDTPGDISFGSVACAQAFSARLGGPKITFEIDSDATHTMHGNLDVCRAFLVDFDPTRRMQIQVANGEFIYGEGCGRLAEGGLLTEEVWHVPGIGNRGLLSTFPAVANGVDCLLNRNGAVFSKDGVVLAKGFLVPSCRNFQIQFAVRDRNRNPQQGQAFGASITMLPLRSRIQLLHNRLNHIGSTRMLVLLRNSLALRLPIADTEATLAKIADLDCFCCGIAKAQSFPHWHRHPELFAGQKQVIHDYLHPRGIRRGQYPYEFLAIDIKPNLPGAYTGETILGMIECGYTNEKFPFGLKSKDLELLAIQDFYAQTVVARGFKTRRIRFDKSLEQTSANVYAWARAEGMHLEFTPARNSPRSQPAENGLKLCMIGTRTLLLAGGLPARRGC